jgi:peroxiredoxin family protein
MVGCQMTMDLFELNRDDMLPGLDYVGAASYLEIASKSDMNLFI